MKRWEYRNIHVLLAPVYLQMLGWCLRYGVTPMGIFKANYGLDHGGATFASKFAIQMSFPQDAFPPTTLLGGDGERSKRLAQITEFARAHGYPVVLKPDQGRIGYGVTLLHNDQDAQRFVDEIAVDYLLQAHASGPLEFGVFYVRQRGEESIFAINSKEFPAVTGTGEHSVAELIDRDTRLATFKSLFNQQAFSDVPAAGESVVLSSVGSHTLGCVFRDVTYLRTQEMLDAVHASVGIDGFNYGRLDVRSASIEAFQRGDFEVIEVNGVESLATNAFDPAFSYRQGLRWFRDQYRLLIEIASEHKDAEMDLLGYREFYTRVVRAEDSIARLGSLVHFAPAAQKNRA
ncbi:MAG: hypothetical protein AAGL66_13950 [Pseudomonadota bacterium]